LALPFYLRGALGHRPSGQLRVAGASLEDGDGPCGASGERARIYARRHLPERSVVVDPEPSPPQAGQLGGSRNQRVAQHALDVRLATSDSPDADVGVPSITFSHGVDLDPEAFLVRIRQHADVFGRAAHAALCGASESAFRRARTAGFYPTNRWRRHGCAKEP